jgi:hypothetical protein
MRRPACEHVFHQWIQRQTEYSANATLNSSQCLFITGSHGIGKTQWVKEMCEGIGHRILWLTPDKCETSSQMESMLKKMLFSTIDTVFDDFPLKDYTIVIDDWDHDCQRPLHVSLFSAMHFKIHSKPAWATHYFHWQSCYGKTVPRNKTGDLDIYVSIG